MTATRRFVLLPLLLVLLTTCVYLYKGEYKGALRGLNRISANFTIAKSLEATSACRQRLNNPNKPSKKTSSEKQHHSTKQPYFFYRDPEEFADLLEDCITDNYCHIYYHHGQKTGGSTIAYKMSTLMNYPQYSNDDWCCSHMLQRFNTQTALLCNKPFMPAEVTGEQFQKMVKTCMALLNDKNSNARKKHRAIVWTSIREPIQRTLSMINQKCNKNCLHSKCSKELKDACERCDYSSDPHIWDSFVRDTNKVYRDIQMVAKMRLPNVRVLSIDTPDISQLFAMLHSRMPHLNINNSQMVKNPEKSDYCNFAMTSGQFRDLAPSEAIYRNFTMGLRRQVRFFL